MHRNAPTIPPPGRCYVCGKSDVNWIDDERNLCGDCICTHVLCDSCGRDLGPLETFKRLPGFDAATTMPVCGACLVEGKE